MNIIAMDFGNAHTKFDVFLTKHGWEMTYKFGMQIFRVTLMLKYVSSKKMCLETFYITLEGSQNKQHDTKNTCTNVRKKVH